MDVDAHDAVKLAEGVTHLFSIRSDSRPWRLRPLIERLAQGHVTLLLLAPVAAAGHGAVDDEVMAVDEAGFVAGQEHRGMGDVIREAGARDRLRGLVDLTHHR